MTTDANDDEFYYWLAENPPPSVEDLIKQYGSYLDIPAEAWTRWDKQMSDWQQRRRDRLFWGAR